MAVTAAGEAVGVEVREVVLKDVVLAAELRAAYAAGANPRQAARRAPVAGAAAHGGSAASGRMVKLR